MHNMIYNPFRVLFSAIILILCATGAAAQQPQSPFDMAMRLERDLAYGIGFFMPDTNRTFAINHGAMALPSPDNAGFPQAFLDGLAPSVEYGVATYPVTLRVDDDTGVTVFYNADDMPFWNLAPAGGYSSDWILQLRCGDTTSPSWQEAHSATAKKRITALSRPSHVEMQWVFVAEADAQTYHNGRIAAQMAARRSGVSEGTRDKGPEGPQLWITEFSVSTNLYTFTAAWNHLVVFPEGTLEVWFTESLAPQNWTNVATFAIADTAESVEFSLTRENIFGAAIEPAFAHEPDCEPEIYTAPSPLNPGEIYTNAVCACYSNWKAPTGFFRLKIPGTEMNVGELPLWWKMYYGLDPWYDWDESLDFSGDGYTNLDAYLLGRNPIAPPNTVGVTPATIQYDYDDDDRLTHAFIGAEGCAVIRLLSPAGNAEVQQERKAP